jgi:RNA polymerase sigma-70 factor (ECF subfamily)
MAEQVLPDEPDSSLVERARAGSSDAYAVLVARHQEVAFRVAFHITRDPDDGADAAQQAFIKAYRALAGFRRDAPFRPWLLRIVENEARNLRRAERARTQLLLRLDRPPDEAPPEASVLADERRQDLLEALDRVDDADRRVIMYRYFFQLDEAEMADALGCPRGTVKSRLFRAIARLRLSLAEPRPTEDRSP